MSPFKKILPFNALRPEQLGQVICPNLTYLSILDLCDDPDALDGGEAALRALCDAQGREWDWDWWDNNERTELVEALWNLIDHGIYVVHQTTSFPPALPAFHEVDGQWQVTREVRQMSHAHDRFVHKLETFRQHEQELKEWQSRNQPPTREPEYLPAVGPGYRKATLGPHVGGSIQATKTDGSPAPEVIAARKESARQFYQKQGMPEHKIEAHMEGIDFSKPVERVKLGKGTIVEQHQIPNAAQGNYYSQAGTDPRQLGISNNVLNRKTGELVSRQPQQYLVNQETEALRSSARAVEDTWSVPGKSIKTGGGGTQYFTMQRGNFTAT